MDMRLFERESKKILDVLSNGRITNNDLVYVAFYTAVNAHPRAQVIERLIEFTEHVKVERERLDRANANEYTLW